MKNTIETRLQTLEDRLEAGERAADRWRRGALGSWVLLAGALAVGFTRPRSVDDGEFEHVRATTLDVVNASGDVIVRLGADGEGRGEVGVRTASGGLAAYLGATADGHGAVVAQAMDGTVVGFLGADSNGDGGMRVSTADNEQVFYVGADVRGNGCVSADVKAGGRIWR